MLILALVAAVMLLAMAALLSADKRSRHPLMLQWGRFTNTRPGIKDHQFDYRRPEIGGWTDEPDVVEYEDFRYWLRVHPNPGINLPVVGYWSKANGRRR